MSKTAFKSIGLLGLCVAIYYTALAAAIPYIGDDVLFYADFLNLCPSGRWSFKAYAEYVGWLREVDNARLTNVLFSLFITSGQKWLTDISAGLFGALMVAALARFFARKFRPVALVMLVIMVFFPWREYSLASCNFFNTMLPGALTVLFLAMLFSRGRTLPGMIIALPAGWIHEGYSIPVLCALGAVIILRRWRPARRQWLMMAAYFLGALWVASSPGILHRLLFSASAMQSSGLKGLLTMSMPLCLCAAAWLCAMLSKRARRAVSFSPLDWVLLIVFVLSAFIGYALNNINPRALWIPCLFATLLTVRIFAPVLTAIPRWAVTVAICLWAAFSLNVLRNQVRIGAEQLRIEREIDRSPHGTVFADISQTHPPLTFLHTSAGIWNDFLQLWGENKRRAPGQIRCVVPAALAQITSAQARAINLSQNPGPAFTPVPSKPGWWIFGGEIIAPGSPMIIYNNWGEPEDQQLVGIPHAVKFSGDTAFSSASLLHQRFITADGDSLTRIFHVTNRPISDLR